MTDVEAGLGIDPVWKYFRSIAKAEELDNWTGADGSLDDLAALTDQGKVRSNNEDAHLAWRWSADRTGSPVTVLLIADGVGGAEYGEVASALTVNTVAVELFRALIQKSPEPPGLDDVRKSLFLAQEVVCAEAARRGLADNGMGTTAVVAVIFGRTLHLTHVGDSRAYLFGRAGLSQVTEDHSLVSELVRLKRIDPEQARRHSLRHVITQVVGKTDGFDPEGRTLNVEDGDTVLLCTDGLTDMLENPEIEQTMRAAAGVPRQAERLIGAALDAGGRDNVTVVLARAPGSSPAGKIPALSICQFGRVRTYRPKGA